MKISKGFFSFASKSLFSPLTLHKTDFIYQNPLHRVRQILDTGIFKENEFSFSPGMDALKTAENLFVTQCGHEIKLISSTFDPDKYPSHDLPEVAFFGQTNSGKSSLIKALFKELPDFRIKVSKKPGRTKSVQFFKIGSKLCIVDTPGYGACQPPSFTYAVEHYFKKRKNLIRAVLLIDGIKGFEGWDEMALEILEEFRIPYVFVMTKIDSGTDSLLLKNFLHLRNIKDRYTSLCCFPQIFMISCHTYEGLAYFQALLAHITGNLMIDVSYNA